MVKCDRLDEDQFSYKSSKEGTLFVYWNGKHVRTYSGHKAASILEELASADSDCEVQFAIARVTGNADKLRAIFLRSH